MAVREVIALRAFEAENADDFAFRGQWHDEFRNGFAVHVQVARILRYIGDAEGFVQLRPRPNKSGSQRQRQLPMFLLVRADDEPRLQQAVTFVEEKDRE